MASNQNSSNKPWYLFKVSQPFKWSKSNTKAHSGIDLDCPLGTPIISPVSGQIVGASCHAWGIQVDIRFTSGGQTDVLSFLHLMSLAPGIKNGQIVQPGTLLGYSGGVSSGVPCPTDRKYSTGAHLHVELTAGSIPPYTTYNPQRPTASSYPINPSTFLATLRQYGIFGAGENGSPAVYTAADYAAALDGGNLNALLGVGSDAIDSDVGAGATASQLLAEVPGFFGICAALDAVEQFSPYSAPTGLTGAIDTPGYTVKWLAKNTIAVIVRVALILTGMLILFALILGIVNVNKWLQEASGIAIPLAIAAMA